MLVHCPKQECANRANRNDVDHRLHGLAGLRPMQANPMSLPQKVPLAKKLAFTAASSGSLGAYSVAGKAAGKAPRCFCRPIGVLLVGMRIMGNDAPHLFVRFVV
jgi:hypothetical protein